MRPNTYQRRALRTINPDLSERDQVINTALGLTGESGEYANLIKKWAMQGHPLSMKMAEKVKKELGDILWYVAVASDQFGFRLEEIMHCNIEKLLERYPEGFDPKRSRKRS